MSSPSDSPQNADQTALACYLGAVVAIGNCIVEVCPSVGAMYRDRLLKLPRRLGFDATPQSLQQSREAVERDLAEYAATVGAWIRSGLHRAEELRDHLQTTEETLTSAADLQGAFLDELAEHLEMSAQADDEAQLRRSVHRYASGLRAFGRRTNAEKIGTSIHYLQGHRQEIEAWLAWKLRSPVLSIRRRVYLNLRGRRKTPRSGDREAEPVLRHPGGIGRQRKHDATCGAAGGNGPAL